MSGAKIFLIAGEASGDQLGAGLMRALRQLDPAADFHGIGGSLMAEQGLESLFPMSDLSFMGFAEVLPHIPKLKRRIRETIATIERIKPDVVITIDSPGFNLRVAQALKKRKKLRCPFIHYVAPTVWAYKPKRAEKFARVFDHLLVLLPFEPPYFEAVKLPVTFVGHPVMDDLEERFRQRPKMGPITPDSEVTLCLMAGSREGEIRRLLPIYRQALELIALKYPKIRLRIATTPQNEALMLKLAADWPFTGDIALGVDARYEAFYESDLAICKSGTVTLEAAKTGLPMVVTYRVNPLTALLMRRWLKTKLFNLINIIKGEAVIPELIQEKCTAPYIAEQIIELLESHHAREKQRHSAYEIMRQMRAPEGGLASDLAARTVLEVLAGSRG
jgi:lipid-A-disaccharide synthase